MTKDVNLMPSDVAVAAPKKKKKVVRSHRENEVK